MPWYFAAALSALFAALVAIFGKVGLKSADPTLASSLRGIVMAIVLIVIVFAEGKWRQITWESFGAREWFFILLAGLAGALSWLFYFLALKNGDVAKVSAIDRASILLVVAFAVLFLQETLTWKLALGSFFVAVGMMLMIF